MKGIIRILIVLMLVFFAGRYFVSQQALFNSYRKESKLMDSKIETQQNKLLELDEKEKTYTSDEVIEKIARERLGLIRVDETIFVYGVQ